MLNRSRGAVRRLPESAYDVMAELALIAFSMALIASFLRLFIDTSFFVPIAASTLTAHVLAAAVRWARGGIIISTLVSMVGLVVAAVLLFPPTTVVDAGGFLNRAVVDGFVTDLGLAWDQFQAVLAPAEVTAPFLLLISIVMWVVAFLSDWAAFRLRSSVEALVPGIAVFVFGSLFAADQSRLLATILFLGTALFFVLTHRLGEAATSGAWLGRGAVARGQSAMLKGGVALLLVTMVSGATVAQALPGYGEEPQFDISELDEPSDPRVVLSPLVDIRSRLVNQPDVEVFTVKSDRADYWRITSLDVFDGRIWRSKGAFEGAAGPLDTALPDGTSFEAVTQQFDINRLGGIWMPAAYEPSEVLAKPDDVTLEYETESGTLIVNREREDSDGLSYTLNSAIPNRDAAAIAAGGNGITAEIADRYLDLPSDFSTRVTEQAEQIVEAAGATTPYEKALALQNFFRDPSLFQYSLDISNGHSSERLEQFLFETRIGYCEQFSGTYAAMARSIGLPARVAVGFTTGERDATDPTIFRVNGRHAHAWPEVWIEDIGWLRFEPTPGRGAPGDQAYTGQAEAQASDLPGAPATTAPESATGPNQVPQGEEQPGGLNSPTTTAAPQSERSESGVIGGPGGVSGRVLVAWLVGLGVLGILLFAPLTYGIFRSRRRQRAAAHDPRRRVGVAWTNAKNSLSLLGVSVRDSATPSELVELLTKADKSAAPAFAELAEEVTVATYAGDTVDAKRAMRMEAISSDMASRAKSQMGGLSWWAHHANPRNVWATGQGVWGNLRPTRMSS